MSVNTDKDGENNKVGRPRTSHISPTDQQ